MFDAIAPRYDLVNRVMTFRMDVGWRKRTLRDLALPHGSTVLDLACGTGDFCRGLAAMGLRPVGIDMSLGMLQAARTDAPLVQADALRLPQPYLPSGLKYTGTEGAGEVQTPLVGPGTAGLEVGDRVWFRHTKAGELCERFDAVHLVRDERLVRTVPTYRGEGRTFL